jgi:hypothetical protein
MIKIPEKSIVQPLLKKRRGGETVKRRQREKGRKGKYLKSKIPK